MKAVLADVDNDPNPSPALLGMADELREAMIALGADSEALSVVREVWGGGRPAGRGLLRYRDGSRWPRLAAALDVLAGLPPEQVGHDVLAFRQWERDNGRDDDPDLPPSLRSVDDVHRVCEAAGLDRDSDGDDCWGDGAARVEVARAGDAAWLIWISSDRTGPTANVYPNQPSYLLLAAIRSAREETP